MECTARECSSPHSHRGRVQFQRSSMVGMCVLERERPEQTIHFADARALLRCAPRWRHATSVLLGRWSGTSHETSAGRRAMLPTSSSSRHGSRRDQPRARLKEPPYSSRPTKAIDHVVRSAVASLSKNPPKPPCWLAMPNAVRQPIMPMTVATQYSGHFFQRRSSQNRQANRHRTIIVALNAMRSKVK
jgi:hypothetical protein